MTALLRAEGLTKAFGNFRAVNGVDLEIPEGGVTAIIGPNGGGKTTLIDLLTGRLHADQGRILFHGEDVTGFPPSQRIRRGMGRSFQIVNIFPHLKVRESVTIPVLAHAEKGLWLFRKRTGMPEVEAAVEGILGQVGLIAAAGKLAGLLSHGDQRLLEIGLALATEPHLLILDEPTSGLNVKERRQVVELLAGLTRSAGLTLVLVEHDMDVVFALADRVIVLHQGRVLAQGTPEQMQQDERVRDVYLGTPLGTRLARGAPASLSGGDRLLEVREIDTYYGASRVLREVTFDVRRGEAVALLGRNGVGKTTTLRSVMGLTPPARGSIRLRGQEIAGHSADLISSLGVGYVPEDRRIFPDLTTLENLRLPTQVRRNRNGRWTVERVEAIFPPLASFRNRKGRHLSGGEQKLLAIGRALMADPDLLLLDEPSEGLGPLVVKLVLDALVQIREEGVTILLADQNLKFAQAVADRAYILDKGTISYASSMEVLPNEEDVVSRYLAV